MVMFRNEAFPKPDVVSRAGIVKFRDWALADPTQLAVANTRNRNLIMPLDSQDLSISGGVFG